MADESWRAFYASDLQSVWSLVVVPAVLLLLALTRPTPRSPILPGAERFLRLYVIVFALETILDPIATGPLSRLLGLADAAATAVLLVFVLLGDFRVLVLVFALADRAAAPIDVPATDASTPPLPLPTARGLGRAAAVTFVVPLATLVAHRGLEAVAGPLPSQSIWLVYELFFVALALGLRARAVPAHVPAGPRRTFLGDVLAYVVLYYALWATADVLILGLGLDAGWALRVIPNQLYYAWYLPFVWRRAFPPR